MNQTRLKNTEPSTIRYYEACIPSDEQIIKTAFEVGYTHLFVEDHPSAEGIIKRVTIKPPKLRSKIHRERQDTQLLAVHCLSVSDTNVAFQNPDVDIISFPQEDIHQLLTPHLARQATKNHKAVQISLLPLLTNRGIQRIKLIYRIRTAIQRLIAAQTLTLLTTTPKEYYHLRPPRTLIALANMIDIPDKWALEAITKTPEVLMKRRGI